MITPPPTYTIHLIAPGEAPRVYPASAADSESAIVEARALAADLAPGGTVQVYLGAPELLTGSERPLASWEV